MKIKNAMLIPLAIVADIATLGNMGERSFTQQLFDSDEKERMIDATLARRNEPDDDHDRN